MNRKVHIAISFVFGSPYFLALLPAAVVILLLPFNFQMFSMNQIDAKRFNSLYYYHDLDNDGYDEMLGLRYNTRSDKNGSIYIYDEAEKENLVDQINTIYQFEMNAHPIFSDYNNNGLDETFLFMIQDSSLYLVGFEFDKDRVDQKLMTDIFIDYVSYRGEAKDYRIFPGPVIDVNGDGFDDLVFVVKGLFCAKPRFYYVYDIKNNVLNRSVETAMAFFDPIYYTISNDNAKDIFFASYCGSSHNYSGNELEYHDKCGWAFLLDKNLQFAFPPQPSKQEYYRGVFNIPFSTDTMTGVISLFKAPYGNGESHKLVVYNKNGSVFRKRDIGEGDYKLFTLTDDGNGEFYLFDVNRKSISKWNEHLEKLQTISFDAFAISIRRDRDIFIKNIDGDPEPEYMFYDSYGKLLITDENFKHRCVFDIPVGRGLTNIQTFVSKEYAQPVIVVSKKYERFLYTYDKNPLFYLQYPIWLIIYLAFFAMFFFSLRYQKRVTQMRYEQKQKLYQSQLLAIKNQIDQHFTLNSINNISSMFMAGDVEEAQSYLTRLTRIMYRGLMSSEKLMNTLQDELGFVEDYLCIQKHRFKDLFDYRIDIDNRELYRLFVPGHVIYTYVENALKHGLRPLRKGGILTIVVEEPTPDLLRIVIDDNGIGRKEAKKQGFHSTGKGTGIAKSILALFKEVNDVYIDLKYIDKEDEQGRSQGTKVILEMGKVTNQQE